MAEGMTPEEIAAAGAEYADAEYARVRKAFDSRFPKKACVRCRGTGFWEIPRVCFRCGGSGSELALTKIEALQRNLAMAEADVVRLRVLYRATQLALSAAKGEQVQGESPAWRSKALIDDFTRRLQTLEAAGKAAVEASQKAHKALQAALAKKGR